MQQASDTAEEPKANPGLSDPRLRRANQFELAKPELREYVLRCFIDGLAPRNRTTSTLMGIMRAINTNQVELWWVMNSEAERAGIVATMMSDDLFGRRTFNILIAKATGLSATGMRQIYDQLKLEAEDRLCSHIEYLTENPKAAALGRQLGFVRQYRMIRELDYE